MDRHGTDLHQQPEHVRLRKALDDTGPRKVKDGNPRQNNLNPRRRNSHERPDVPPVHRKSECTDISRPQHLMDGKLWLLKRGKDSLVELPNLRLPHWLRRIPVQADAVIVKG